MINRGSVRYSDHLSKFIVASIGDLHSLFIRHQFVRYILIGIGNTAFSFGVYSTLLFVGFEYRIASLLALVVGIIFSFITQGTVVFKNVTRMTFAKFVIAWIIIYILNISVIAFLMHFSMNAYLAGAIATLPVTLVSYFIFKLVVFAHRNLTEPQSATE